MVKSTKKKVDAKKQVVLSGSLSLGRAGEIREELLLALDESKTVHILLQDVDDVDLSLVQILCAVHRSALNMKKSVQLDDCPEIFDRLAEEAGLQGHVGCSLAVDGDCLWLTR